MRSLRPFLLQLITTCKRHPKWIFFVLGTSVLSMGFSVPLLRSSSANLPSTLPISASLSSHLMRATEIPTALMPMIPSSAAGQCEPVSLASTRSQQTHARWLKNVTWLAAPTSQVETVLASVAPQVLASVNPVPWPALHPRSQMAKVPVIMYHDILPEMQVFFDVTPEQLREDFELIREKGLTPISLGQLVAHLRTGVPLPEKPVLLTFDDGYEGHYKYVYPLLKEFGYPAVFSIFTAKVDGQVAGRSTVTWEQLQEMAADPLVTIASHSVTHVPDMRELPDSDLQWEMVESKRRLEEQLGIPIRYFTYPEGKHDERVVAATEAAGYVAALEMNDNDERFAGESESLMAIARFGQSRLEEVVDQAWGGPPLPTWSSGFDFDTPIQLNQLVFDDVPLLLASGGWPVTIHADSRYQVAEIIENTAATAAVDGGFFSMKYLDSNVMIGPVFSQVTGQFVPGNESENLKLAGRPLVLISPDTVKYVPFDPAQHNTLAGVRTELPNVTDAFVAAAWLVKQGEPQPPKAFGTLFDFDVPRHRAFWGINQSGQPVVGISTERVDSVALGEMLSQAGLRDAVMLDSGASTSLVYQGETLVGYEPRPVPHVVALVPPEVSSVMCPPVTISDRTEDSENPDLL